jgi:hypothetical protein
VEAPDATRPRAPRNTLIFVPKFIATVAETPSARRVAVNKP